MTLVEYLILVILPLGGGITTVGYGICGRGRGGVPSVVPGMALLAVLDASSAGVAGEADGFAHPCTAPGRVGQ